MVIFICNAIFTFHTSGRNHKVALGMIMVRPRAVIVGAGVGGLAAAIDLAVANWDVTVVERAAFAGGKMREVSVGDAKIDSGPTVLTMASVFEALFSDAGARFSDFVALEKLQILARHAWPDGSRLDLFADKERSANAIARFAGSREAEGFLAFATRAEKTYRTLENTYIRSDRPTPTSLALSAGLGGLADLWRISPFSTLWNALGDHFQDYRLRQLFARYATYCGSSPFESPATLMLVADVERQGVWTVQGGMQRLADSLVKLAQQVGVTFVFERHVKSVLTTTAGVSGVELADGERLSGDCVVINADPWAVSSGQFGRDIARAVPSSSASRRSLSALTVSLKANTHNFPLHRHNVFFSADYKREFDDIFGRSTFTEQPTVYVCAMDRHDIYDPEFKGPDRLLCLINAPPNGDDFKDGERKVRQNLDRLFASLERCGLVVDHNRAPNTVTTPESFHQLFPATGGALYGQASHGWTASFNRPTARTAIPRLYLAGGATHPGPGVPMAALSGRLAARAAVEDRTSK
jgi:1-hydroxycarotenoid 3,4-desaturase